MSVEHRNPLLQQYQATAKAITSSVALTGNDSGKSFTNTNATASVTLTLPKAKPGRAFAFLGNAATALVVQPLAADAIRGSSAGAATSLATGTLLVLLCVVTGVWEITNGTTGGGGGGGTSPYNVSPDTHAALPTGVGLGPNDEFEGTVLDTSGSRYTGATAWTWQNQGSATATLQYGRLILTCPSTPATPYNNRCIFQPLPSGNWKYRIKRTTDVFPSSNFSWSGMILWDSVGGKAVDFHRVYSSGYTTEVDTWGALSTSTVSTPQGGSFFSTAGYPWSSPVYQEIEYDGTNYNFRYSFDGGEGTFVLYYAATPAALMGTTANNIGINIAASSGSTAYAYIDWFRRIT